MSIETLEENSSETYADKKLGMYSGMFDEDAKQRLNTLYATLDATFTPAYRQGRKEEHERLQQEALKSGASGVYEFDPDPEIDWVLNESERLNLCTPEEADDLRTHFIMPGIGLPLVLNF